MGTASESDANSGTDCQSNLSRVKITIFRVISFGLRVHVCFVQTEVD